MFDPTALVIAVRAGRANARSGLPAAPTAAARPRPTPPLRARTAATLRRAARLQQRIADRLDSAAPARCA